MKKSCTNCIHFSSSIGIPLNKADYPDIIGECRNSKVSNRICTDRGMLCNGTHHENPRLFKWTDEDILKAIQFGHEWNGEDGRLFKDTSLKERAEMLERFLKENSKQ